MASKHKDIRGVDAIPICALFIISILKREEEEAPARSSLSRRLDRDTRFSLRSCLFETTVRAAFEEAAAEEEEEEEEFVMSSSSALERAMARTLDAFARRAAAAKSPRGGAGLKTPGGGSEKSGDGVVLSQSRAVVRLSGSDRAKLLQGLVTNDVDVLAWEKDEERRKR